MLYGRELQHRVGFYRPIQSVRKSGKFSFHVVTDWGEYEFIDIHDKDKIRIETITGEDLRDLGKLLLEKII